MSDELLFAYVNLDEVDKALSDVVLRAKRMGPAFRAARKPLRADQRAHARLAQGSTGPWPPRARATEERRRMRNKRTRTPKALRTISPVKLRRRSTPKALLGKLPNALKVATGDLFIRATSRPDFGYAHNRGAMVGHGRKVELPQREFLYISDELLVKTRDIFIAHVMKGWKK